MSTARFFELLLAQLEHQLVIATDQVERAVLLDQINNTRLAILQLSRT